MSTITLEISGSTIFVKENQGYDNEFVTVNIGGPAPVRRRRTGPIDRPNKTLKTGPEDPIYRLPQSISSGGLKIHLDLYTKPKPVNIDKPNKRASLTQDEDSIIFEISKSSLGDSAHAYKINNFHREDNEGNYGRGTVKFTPGWIRGGVWEIEYYYKVADKIEEQRVDMRIDEAGGNDGLWKMTFPFQGNVAKEHPQPADSFGENGRSFEIISGDPGLEGVTESEWRDLLTACWITKVWDSCTRTGWFSASVKGSNTEAGALGNW
ncbi:hypothetical protein FPQ18DRAFT_316667 [Pyronema domesticum]|uniref:Uncharacterized protein n=1 Tax=Pyronema omphalodes (strain CBS 100304) TaxID=1076935 RepID=U4LG39_PYROM|nr:hypothetical protein FPQ18DRAFT_316667 [Pyronema domesticum]CCX14893.1 Similar to hypothetical protein [Tuber melanosporum Mel28]; acc. no. XP_002838810 [Pyronema omphalodes CBS 100304]